MDLLEDIFLPHGQVPWDELINPLWAELVSSGGGMARLGLRLHASG